MCGARCRCAGLARTRLHLAQLQWAFDYSCKAQGCLVFKKKGGSLYTSDHTLHALSSCNTMDLLLCDAQHAAMQQHSCPCVQTLSIATTIGSSMCCGCYHPHASTAVSIFDDNSNIDKKLLCARAHSNMWNPAGYSRVSQQPCK